MTPHPRSDRPGTNTEPETMIPHEKFDHALTDRAPGGEPRCGTCGGPDGGAEPGRYLVDTEGNRYPCPDCTPPSGEGGEILSRDEAGNLRDSYVDAWLSNCGCDGDCDDCAAALALKPIFVSHESLRALAERPRAEVLRDLGVWFGAHGYYTHADRLDDMASDADALEAAEGETKENER